MTWQARGTGMAETGALEDPAREPWAIIWDSTTGHPRRNDGGLLTSAQENPWYVLATAEGEQVAGEFDHALHARNRRIWNGWACAGLSPAERERLAEDLRLPPSELAPLDRREGNCIFDKPDQQASPYGSHRWSF